MPLAEYPAICIGNRGVRFDWIFSAILISVLSITLLLRNGRIRLGSVQIAALLFFLSSVLSLVNVKEIGDYLTMEIQLVIGVVLILAASNIEFSLDQLESLFKCYVIVSLLLAVYGLYQFAGNYFNWPYTYLEFTHPAGRVMHSGYEEGLFTRPTALFSEPRRLGLYILGPAVVMLYYAIIRRENKGYLFGAKSDLLFCATFVIAILILRSLATYLLFFFAVLVAMILEKRIRFLLKLCGLVSLLAIVIVVLGQHVFDDTYIYLIKKRFVKLYGNMVGIADYLEVFVEEGKSRGGTSLTKQVANMIDALRIGLRYPVVGIGLNNFGRGLESYLMPSNNCKGLFHIFATMGSIGLFSFLFFVYTLLRNLNHVRIKTQFSKKGDLAWVSLMLTCIAFSKLLVFGNFAIIWLWFEWFLACLVFHNVRKHRNVQP